jgi:hypothetical protein
MLPGRCRIENHAPAQFLSSPEEALEGQRGVPPDSTPAFAGEQRRAPAYAGALEGESGALLTALLLPQENGLYLAGDSWKFALNIPEEINC